LEIFLASKANKHNYHF